MEYFHAYSFIFLNIMVNKRLTIKKILFWGLFTLNLFIAYFIGYLGSIFFPELSYLYILILLPLIVNIFLLKSYKFKQEITFRKEILILVYSTLNLLFGFIIGVYQPFMESNSRIFFPIIMLPMLIILHYVILNRFQFYLSDFSLDDTPSKDSLSEEIKGDKPIIEYEDKKYSFSIESLLILAIGAPVSAYLIYLFFDLEINYWLHEIVVKQTVYFLNFLFNMGVEAQYNPGGSYEWSFINIGSQSPIFFQTFCTGVQAICVFAGVIIFTPHSRDKETNRDILWRKTKSLVISSVIFYVVNILRMIIQIYLYYIGYPWDSIHYSISAASSFIAAIIVLLMHKWIPEFIISIIYSFTLLKQKIKKNSKGH
ncbi:MAG: archaeosortase H [Promethearchaeati archaeon]